MKNAIVNVVSLAIFTAMLCSGQVMFKQLGLAIRGQPVLEGMVGLLRHPTLYVVLSIYGLATLLWIWILSRVPLMQAYPWVALGTAIVPLMGWYFFGERVTPAFWPGLILILVGMFLTQYASSIP